jgi:hypothetical protein
MSGGDSFFARWSRQKRCAARRSDAKEHPPSSAPEILEPASPTTGETPPAIPLPPLGSIESAPGIQAFLAPGVPLELTRAALRRAWATDPAIRDFIGLSENAWDFNAPGGVPGFGSLDLDGIRRLVAQVLDEPRLADPTSATAPVGDGPATPAHPTIHQRENIAAAQQKNQQSEAPEYRCRRHGSALPQ